MKNKKWETVTASHFLCLSSDPVELHTFLKKDPLIETNKILNRWQRSLENHCLWLYTLLFLVLFYSFQVVLACFLRHRIVTMSAPGVASEQSAYCQIKSFYGAVLPECFEGILRTCGGEAA